MQSRHLFGIYAFSIAWAMMFPDSGWAATRYVSPTGGNVSPYTSWSTAAIQIQSAINVSSDGDFILVTNGVYSTGFALVDGVTNRIAVTNQITVQSVNGPSFTAIVGAGPDGNNAIRCAYVGMDAYLNGFTLTNGYAELYGGGAFCEESGMLRTCLVVNCQANSGGGVYHGNVLFSTFRGNKAVLGGGYYGFYTGLIQNCVFERNISTSDGAGAYNPALLRNCAVVGNRAGQTGGGVWNPLTMESCTVLDNFARDVGGVYAGMITNSIIYHNRAFNRADNVDSLSACGYTCTTPLQTGTGNFTNDPQVAGLRNPRLTETSPCLNAGTNQGWMATAVDLDGKTRVIGTRVDIGCDEFFANLNTGTIQTELNADCGEAVLGYPVIFQADSTGRITTVTFEAGDGSLWFGSGRLAYEYDQTGTYKAVFTAANLSGLAADTVTVRIVAGYTNYVAPGGSHTNGFRTWTTAATNLQAAVDVCAKGGLVLVSNGVYGSGAVSLFSSNRVAVTNPLVLRGIHGASNTFIRGNASATMNAIRPVYLCRGARLEGFTLLEGRSRNEVADAWLEITGGGLLAEEGARVVDCIISNNGAMYGGGIFGYGVYTNCRVADNSAGYDGGGLYHGEFWNGVLGDGNNANRSGGGASYAYIVNSRIENNVAHSTGGGTEGGSNRHCVIRYNTVSLGSYSGGGAGMGYSEALDCLVSYNTVYGTSGRGGGAHSCLLRNCTVIRNEAAGGAGTYYSRMLNCIVYGNYDDNATSVQSCDYTCISPDPGGVSNIVADPEFAAPWDADFHLTTNSPCVDTAETDPEITSDLDGISRPLDGNNGGEVRPDRGCYELANALVDQDGDGLSDAQEAYQYYTDPRNGDTDTDTQLDGGEIVAGTDPKNGLDYFAWKQALPANQGYVVQWSSITGRTYRLESSSAVTGVWMGVAGYTNIAGTGNQMSYTNNTVSTQMFHRILVRKSS
jgi:hypothetical protein